MAPPLDINGICTGLGDPAAESLCRQTLAGCQGSWKGDASRAYCIERATSCSAQKKEGKSSFRLVMPNQGVVEVNTPSDCFQTTVRIAKAFWPQEYQEPAASGPAAESTSPGGASSTPLKEQLPPTGKKPADTSVPLPSDETRCQEAGSPGTPAFIKCMELVGICRSKETDGYQLPFGSQSIFVANQVGCLIMAPRVARAQFPGDQKPAVPGAVSGLALFTPDDKQLFGISFAQAGFRPQITPGETSKHLTLIMKYNGARKFIPIKISYRLEAIDSGRYRMTYTIANRTGTTIGGQETVELSASDGLHLDGNLAFGITLNGEGSFGSIASVKIVKLAE